MSFKCKNGSGCVGIVGLAHTIHSYFVTHMRVLQVKVWSFILSHGDSPWSSWSKVIAIKTHQKMKKKQKKIVQRHKKMNKKCRKNWNEMRRENIEGGIKEEEGGRIKK
jgi:hypothetical protein